MIDISELHSMQQITSDVSNQMLKDTKPTLRQNKGQQSQLSYNKSLGLQGQ